MILKTAELLAILALTQVLALAQVLNIFTWYADDYDEES